MASKGMKNYYIIKDDITELYMQNRKGEIFLALIDTEDLNKLIGFGRSWYVKPQRLGNFYAYTTINRWPLNPLTYSLHRLIMGIDPGERIRRVDHKNHDTLDDRKQNLRITTHQRNLQNRNGSNSNNKTGYRNICYSDEKYIIQLNINGKNTVLGKFDTLEDAIPFAEEMRLKYYGEFAGEN